MKRADRKGFLKAGVGSAALAAAGLPLTKYLGNSNQLTFSAAAGLPEEPLPSYATQVVDGQVDLARGTGLVTSRVLAGHPEDRSPVGLPGLTRTVRITQTEEQSRGLRLRGVVEDRSQLHRGESPHVEIVIDRKRGVLIAPFLGQAIEHHLAEN